MNLLRKNKVKITAAYFLLALLVFINAIKAFHQHGHSFNAQNKSVSKNATIVYTNVFCSICAFQIAKDNDAVIATSHISMPEHFAVSYFTFTSLLLRNFSIPSFVRGPPISVS
ncbi:MAG: hypothetical protein ABJA35_05830 [Parafilimonas sp.]